MPEDNTNASTDASTDADATQTDGTDTDSTDWKAEAEKWRTQARKHEDRSKANQAAVKQLEDLRKQSMTDAERAVEEAKATARADAMREVGGRLVAAEFKVAAAGRLSDDAITALMGALDPAPFVDDDGMPDTKAISTFVDGIAPATPEQTSGQPQFLDLGQGARGGETLPLNGDPLMQAVMSKLGIR